jgi:hypothetical protein
MAPPSDAEADDTAPTARNTRSRKRGKPEESESDETPVKKIKKKPGPKLKPTTGIADKPTKKNPAPKKAADLLDDDSDVELPKEPKSKRNSTSKFLSLSLRLILAARKESEGY